MRANRREFVHLLVGGSAGRALEAGQGRPTGGGARDELVAMDERGVVRWRSDGSEVSLFGANYCLASSCDYRAAGYVHADRKRLIRADMAHFARMGWDGLRISFWGDWENSDVQGNLVVNDHLDTLDYLIAEATRRGVYILLTPITTYSSLWPDVQDDPAATGFSRQFPKSELGTNPAAIAAQVNYLQQLLRHVNPYTRRALKDEPNILFIEMINEPWHHTDDFQGSVQYIDALANAVRNTGCRKLLFHNLSQDFRIAAAISASSVQGATFAWYPAGLDMRGRLRGSFVKAVDIYPYAFPEAMRGKPRLVYEFDLADVMSGYHYPAMARAFRQAGAQFAAMFTYDMLATAPYNLSWQVHCLNMVYTPRKAAAAIIAAEAMRRLPRGGSYGAYPRDKAFGPFRVSYEEDRSELLAPDAFFYSNHTRSRPPRPEGLRKVAGCGSSPVVEYEGDGLYFLDRLAAGAWRLELYPDAVQIADPFLKPSLDRPVFRLVSRPWPMTVRLPDLGAEFLVTPLGGADAGGAAKEGRFAASPGVYLLERAGSIRPSLPPHAGRVGLREFICPQPPDRPPDVIPHLQPEYVHGQPVEIAADVIAEQLPSSVRAEARRAGDGGWRLFAMRRVRAYRWAVVVEPETFPPGALECRFVISWGGEAQTFPPESVAEKPDLTTRIVAPTDPLLLFDAADAAGKLDVTRGAWKVELPERLPAGGGRSAAVCKLPGSAAAHGSHGDMTASLYVGDRVAARGESIRCAGAVAVTAAAIGESARLTVTLVEKDGTGWAGELSIGKELVAIELPLNSLRPARWAMLPQGFPGDAAYWANPTRASGTVRIENVERLQLSLRREGSFGPPPPDVDVAGVELRFATPAGHPIPGSE